VGAQFSAGVVEGLVQDAAGGAEPIGEDVDGHAAQGQSDEYVALVRGERGGDAVADGTDQLGVLGLLVRAGCAVRQSGPRLGFEGDLAALPGPPRSLTEVS
jgi:hypothetical protein